MGQRGINPKRWFYQLRTNIERRCPEILVGAASEQWLNAELFSTAVKGLGTQFTAAPEVGKCDIVIAPVRDGCPDWDTPEAIVEVKLVYRRYPPKKIQAYIHTLIEQMKKGRREAKQSYGFLYAVYNVWPDQIARLTFDDFKERVRNILSDELRRAPQVRLAKPYLDTLVKEHRRMIGGAEVRIAVAGQYLLAR